MEKFTILSNQLRLANEFLKEIHRSSRTLSSFSEVLQDQMSLIHFQLADIERRCIKQGLLCFRNFQIDCDRFSIDCTYTLALFHQELESLGIISKGKCLERLFDQISFYDNKANCDLTLELIHVLYKNLLISEMINNITFFVRLFQFY